MTIRTALITEKRCWPRCDGRWCGGEPPFHHSAPAPSEGQSSALGLRKTGSGRKSEKEMAQNFSAPFFVFVLFSLSTATESRLSSLTSLVRSASWAVHVSPAASPRLGLFGFAGPREQLSVLCAISKAFGCTTTRQCDRVQRGAGGCRGVRLGSASLRSDGASRRISSTHWGADSKWKQVVSATGRF